MRAKWKKKRQRRLKRKRRKMRARSKVFSDKCVVYQKYSLSPHPFSSHLSYRASNFIPLISTARILGLPGTQSQRVNSLFLDIFGVFGFLHDWNKIFIL
ncbi:uncharacterized protein VTP21DRAFT_11297 [Calcarisporiella thermophila]|uniref:uncharacterized protein n=1 Tax=Calcarisporiella thermophila TaxID=911321 RepID=UPI003743059D